MILGGAAAASRRGILVPSRGKTGFLLALLGRGGACIRVAICGGGTIALISQAPILFGGLGRRDVREGGTDTLFTALTPRAPANTTSRFDAGFRIVRGCGVGAWVVGGVAVLPTTAAGGGGGVRVEAAAADAGAEGHEGRFEHGQAGAHDPHVGLDGGPDGGGEGAVDLVVGFGAAFEGGHAEDGGDADAGGGGRVSFRCLDRGFGARERRGGEN